MLSGWPDPRPSGKTWASGSRMTPARTGPAVTKRTAAGRRSSSAGAPRRLTLDARMAPKHHPTPLSGGDRKALNKELGKARAMTNILAAQSVEMRAKAETLLQQAERLLCESGNGRMCRMESRRPVADHRPGHQRRLFLAG